MTSELIEVGDGFWNVRGVFRIGGVIDIGTQASLVRLPTGRFVFLDSYDVDGAALREVMKLTDEGRKVEAILNVHPFHTIHCKAMHKRFPDALLYGSERHKSKAPDLPWERAKVEGPTVAERYADTFDFSVPKGVDYISADENVHFSSVLVRHKASATLHVDDTLTYLKLPWPLSWAFPSERILFHPTLAAALEKRPGAADDFTKWTESLARGWDVQTLCAAHKALKPLDPGEFETSIHDALRRVRTILRKHKRKYG